MSSKKTNASSNNNSSSKVAAGPSPPPAGDGGGGGGDTATATNKKPQRTIQVKIGNQAAKEMTPDQAADYLKLIAAASSSSSSGGRRGGPNSKSSSGGGGGAQVRMTFANHGTEATLDFGAAASGGPPPSSMSRSGTTTTTITWGSSSSNNSGGSISNNNKTSDKKKPSKTGGNTKNDTSTSSYAAGFRLGQSVAKSSGSSSSNNNNNTASGTSSNNSSNNNNYVKSSNNTGSLPLGNNNNSGNSNSSNNNNNNMPCTEKEMKALMSMFVEIMGLQMNTDKLNACKTQKFKRREYLGPNPNPSVQKLWETKSDVDKASPEDLLAALELGPLNYEEKNVNKTVKTNKDKTTTTTTDKETTEPLVEEDSFFMPDLPPLEDIPSDLLRRNWPGDTGAQGDTKAVDRLPNPHNYELKDNITRSGIVCGIAVPEWESIERMAMEDALEQEERARKAATAAKRKVWRPLSGTARALDNAAFLEYGNGNLPPDNNNNSKYSGMYGGSTSSSSPSGGGGGGNSSSGGTGSGSNADTNSSASINATAALLKDAAKQRAKKCTAWRNRVVACCQSNNVQSLKEAFKDCPLHKTDAMSMWQPLFPHALPKHRRPLVPTGKEDSGSSTRQALLKFLLETVEPSWFLEPDTRSGRSPLHSACYLNDPHTVGAILEAAGNRKDKDGKSSHPAIPRLDDPCLESGWSCLLYASVAGSLRIVELLLKRGISVTSKTSDTLTWMKSNKQGATVVQFLQHMCLKQKGDKVDGYGMAWSSFEKDVAAAPKLYEIAWTRIFDRLQGLLDRAYVPLQEAAIRDFENALREASKPDEPSESAKPMQTEATAESKPAQEARTEEVGPTEPPKPKKRNKKKKKGGNKGESGAGAKETPPAIAANPLAEDPLTKLLEGMGFEQEPVLQAIQALGGPDKATPDTVIAWMLDHQAESEEPEQRGEEELEDDAEDSDEGFEAIVAEKSSNRSAGQSKKSPRNKKRGTGPTSISGGTKQPPEAAEGEKRLQAKREEQRRRNREWNKRQEEAANATPTLLGAGASLKAPPVPNPITASTHTSSMSNDVSTVASSDVLVNDDATIDSRSTQHQQHQQPPMLLSGLPPMQENSMQTLDSSHPQSTLAAQPTAAPPGFVSSLLSQKEPPPVDPTPTPPGMPESSNVTPLQGLDYSVGGTGLLTSFLGMPAEPAPAPTPPPVASSLFPVAGEPLPGAAPLPGLQHQTSTASASMGTPSLPGLQHQTSMASTGTAPLPGLQHQTSTASSSSLLGGIPVPPPIPAGPSTSSSLFTTDSNSGALRGSSLWGDAGTETPGDLSSSFLLGNVIQTPSEDAAGDFLFNQAQPAPAGFNNRTASAPPPGTGWGGVPPLNPSSNPRNSSSNSGIW